MSYLTTGLTPGMTYIFAVEAHNSNGYSALSTSVSILAAQTPSPPAMPTTVIDGANIIFSWVAPASNGSPIISYTIKIMAHDLTYYLNLAYCDGSKA